MVAQSTPIDEIPKVLETARRAFFSGKTKSIAFRKEQIAQVAYLLKDNEERFIEALKLDLNRPALESELYDIGPVYTEVRDAYDKVEKWAASQRTDFNFSYFAMGPRTKAEPKGVALIISAFNLPVFLTLSPLTSAIAAGCAVVIKPSEADVNVCKLLAELIPQYLDNELYHVVLGGVPETTKLLELRWDHITYIGSARVGRIVAAAAAKHLTPVTMELGGKNPVVVDPRANVKMMAKRILWGRFSNAGQACTAPEYVLVPREFKDTLVSALVETYHEFYPDGPEKSNDFCRIVSQQSAARIKRLIDNTNGKIICGGDADIEKKYIAPTIVDDIKADDALMSEEIFGPVLLIYPVKDVDEAISVIQARDHPLAAYVFSPDKKFQEKVFSNTKSGAALANETLLSPAVPGFPVGGIGGSGYGYYSSKHAFEQFSHVRVSLDNPSWVDTFVFWFRYPPYQANYKKYMSLLVPSLPPRPAHASRAAAQTQKRWARFWAACAVFGVVSALLTRNPALLQLKWDA